MVPAPLSSPVSQSVSQSEGWTFGVGMDRKSRPENYAGKEEQMEWNEGGRRRPYLKPRTESLKR